jgi:uncharacterized protein YqjF (DUF2071 family)
VGERAFLKARWTELVLLNFRVPVEAIAELAPVGTEPDLHEGEAYISIVGFRFQSVRILGVAVPAHTRFDEINLRYYVKRTVGDEVRRGVVFVREIVPRGAVAMLANRLYNENYVTRPMRNRVTMAGSALQVGDTVEYGWRSGGGRLIRRSERIWNRVGARVATAPEIPSAGSLEDFIVEHYWGYVRGRDGVTREYRVEHPTWRVARADDVLWECDLAGTYDTPLADFLKVAPASALVADGSEVRVYRGRRIGSDG